MNVETKTLVDIERDIRNRLGSLSNGLEIELINNEGSRFYWAKFYPNECDILLTAIEINEIQKIEYLDFNHVVIENNKVVLVAYIDKEKV